MESNRKHYSRSCIENFGCLNGGKFIRSFSYMRKRTKLDIPSICFIFGKNLQFSKFGKLSS